ncbi:serine hydrolase domain-containing protein [Nocardiopsis sp. NPDC050513]|uniref:serine hydrolase domain-containing protein n=1 Tax=Nocardiopsis sp. NPDC050513 TaxID=3364338 RepID=UPI0037B5DC92
MDEPAGHGYGTTVPSARVGRPLPAEAPVRVWLVALAVGVVASVLAFLFAPVSPPPVPAVGGDEALADDVATVLDARNVQGLVVARFPVDDPGAVAFARAGTEDGTVPVDEETWFETGALFTTVTAMTLADMVDRGETSLNRTLFEIFPDVDFADPGVAGASLEDLATHHSGLPTVPDGMVLDAYVLPSLTLTDPFADAPPPVEALETTTAGHPGAFRYSDLGFSVLGAALAAESGTPYQELVAERVLEPIGMDDTVIGVPGGGARPHSVPGAPTEPWGNTDYAPAGSATWSTPSDLVRFLTAVTQGAAPGASAVEPVYEWVPVSRRGSDQVALGLSWFTVDVAGVGSVTGHAGDTFGTSTMLAFDDAHGVVVMSNSQSVDAADLAYALLGDAPEPLPLSPPTLLTAAVTAMAVAAPVLLLSLMLRRRTLAARSPLDRLRVVSLSLGAVAWLVAGQRLGDWTWAPLALWALAAGVAAAAVTVGVWHFRGLPTENARWRWVHVPVFVLSVALSLTLGALTLWGLAAAHA